MNRMVTAGLTTRIMPNGSILIIIQSTTMMIPCGWLLKQQYELKDN